MGISKLWTKSFATRLMSSIVLVIVALTTILLGGDVLLVTLLLLSLVGVSEYYKVFGIEKKAPGLVGYAAVVVYYLLVRFSLTQFYLILVVALLMGAMAVYVMTFPKYKTEEIMAVVFGVVYVGVMLSFIYQVRVLENGIYAVWLIFLCSWIADTCAYVVGITMGKHQMTPVLSPKKSIEGGIGGVAGSILLSLLYAWFVKERAEWAVNPMFVFPVICGVGAVISMIGDLAASAVKRNHGIKDYGKLIPGHGGVLDRFDSVIMTAPCIWLLMVLFG